MQGDVYSNDLTVVVYLIAVMIGNGSHSPVTDAEAGPPLSSAQAPEATSTSGSMDDYAVLTEAGALEVDMVLTEEDLCHGALIAQIKHLIELYATAAPGSFEAASLRARLVHIRAIAHALLL